MSGVFLQALGLFLSALGVCLPAPGVFLSALVVFLLALGVPLPHEVRLRARYIIGNEPVWLNSDTVNVVTTP